jgi:TolA-binding protein
MGHQQPPKTSNSTSPNTPTLAPNSSQQPITQSHPDLEARIKRLEEQLNKMEHGSSDLKRMREGLNGVVREWEEFLERKRSGQK